MNVANGEGPSPRAATEAPAGNVRLFTDQTISQLGWWSETLSVLEAPRSRGAWATARMAVALIRQARRNDVVLSASVRNALLVGLYKRLTGRKQPLLVMTEMRLDEERKGLKWRLKLALQRYAYAACDAMCVSSRREISTYSDRLGIPVERFRFIPWHTNVAQPKWHAPNGNYLFAAGRTGRDWRTLAQAVRGLDVAVKVVCSREDAMKVDFPENVSVLANVPYSEYRALLEGSQVVLVPLEEHCYASGQVVVLEAMALGKPVIATRVLGTEDYVRDGVDGLLVSPGSAEELREAISQVLSNPAMGSRLGAAAVQTVIRSHTLEQYARQIVDVAYEAAARHRADVGARPPVN